MRSLNVGSAISLQFGATLLAILLLPILFAGCGYAPTEHNFEHYLARMQPLLDRYGYAIVAAAMLVEGAGIPTPGQTLLIVCALEASQGRVNMTWLLFVVAASATMGNTVGYAIGRWGGRAVLKRLKLNAARQEHLEEIFRRHGGVVIVLGRFLDGFRQLNGIVAGMMRMPGWSFTFYNIIGALLWTSVWVLGTFYFGRDIHTVAASFDRHRWALYGITATILLPGLVWLMRATKLVRLRGNEMKSVKLFLSGLFLLGILLLARVATQSTRSLATVETRPASGLFRYPSQP